MPRYKIAGLRSKHLQNIKTEPKHLDDECPYIHRRGRKIQVQQQNNVPEDRKSNPITKEILVRCREKAQRIAKNLYSLDSEARTDFNKAEMQLNARMKEVIRQRVKAQQKLRQVEVKLSQLEKTVIVLESSKKKGKKLPKHAGKEARAKEREVDKLIKECRFAEYDMEWACWKLKTNTQTENGEAELLNVGRIREELEGLRPEEKEMLRKHGPELEEKKAKADSKCEEHKIRPCDQAGDKKAGPEPAKPLPNANNGYDEADLPGWKSISVVPDYSTPEARAVERKLGRFVFDRLPSEADRCLVNRGPREMLKDGIVYIGQWNKKGKPQGRGTACWKNGEKQIGYWKNGELDGKGRIIRPDGTASEGNFVDGELNGNVILVLSDGCRCEGEWKNGGPNGKGVLFSPNKYVGGFLNGKKHGHGETTYQSGCKDVGEWVNGEKHGKFVFMDADGKLKGSEEWNEGKYMRQINQENDPKVANAV